MRRSDAPAECPACRSRRVVQILYGFPDLTPELQRALDEERAVLGGCVVFEDAPRWHCMACAQRWGRLGRRPSRRKRGA